MQGGARCHRSAGPVPRCRAARCCAGAQGKDGEGGSPLEPGGRSARFCSDQEPETVGGSGGPGSALSEGRGRQAP